MRRKEPRSRVTTWGELPSQEYYHWTLPEEEINLYFVKSLRFDVSYNRSSTLVQHILSTLRPAPCFIYLSCCTPAFSAFLVIMVENGHQQPQRS